MRPEKSVFLSPKDFLVLKFFFDLFKVVDSFS